MKKKLFIMVIMTLAITTMTIGCGTETSETTSTLANTQSSTSSMTSSETSSATSTLADMQSSTSSITSTETSSTLDNKGSSSEMSTNTTKEKAEIVLSNTHVTKFSDVEMITYPKFTFDYPNNWKITLDEVPISKDRQSLMNEHVTLSNERGVTIEYTQTIGHGGLGRIITKSEITKITDSQFTPASVQGNDHSDLGAFMVARIEDIGKMHLSADTDYKSIDPVRLSFAVLPESWAGTLESQRPQNGENMFSLAFNYSSLISFNCLAPSDLTKVEEQEIIEILSSFRLQQ